jgi:predicted RNA-binding protein with PUA-like domain
MAAPSITASSRACWLVKTEPSTYAFGDLVAERTTAWTGVKNPQAQLHLRAMKKGDRVAVYHTGGEKAVVGTAVVAGAPAPDPTDRDGRRVAVRLSAERPLAVPVALSVLRSEPAFAGSPLLLQGRLSVLPLSAAQWKRIEVLGRR